MATTRSGNRRRLSFAVGVAAVLLAAVGVAPVAADMSTRFPTSNAQVTQPNPRKPLADPTNAYADDGIYASGDLTSKVIGGVNTGGDFAQAFGDFGFNAIPATAVITSVSAEMQYKFATTADTNLSYDIILYSGSDAFNGTVLAFATGTAASITDTVLATAPVPATRAQLLDGALGVEVAAETGIVGAQTMLIDYVSVTVTYTVPNQAPVLAPIGDQTVGAGTIKTVSISATDGDGDPLQFGIGSHPSFVALADNGNGTATMTLGPVAGDIGGSPYTVRVGVTDGTDSDYEDVTITVVADTTPPVVTVPADVRVTTPGSAAIPVTYDPATATDLVDGRLTPACVPASGSAFPLGTTTVTCTATDNAGNTGSASFTVTVAHEVPEPRITVPADIRVDTARAAGTRVSFEVTATDDQDGPLTPTCAPPSGSLFPIGTTTVTCTVTDRDQHTGTASFTVTVVRTPAPSMPPTSTIAPTTTTPPRSGLPLPLLVGVGLTAFVTVLAPFGGRRARRR